MHFVSITALACLLFATASKADTCPGSEPATGKGFGAFRYSVGEWVDGDRMMREGEFIGIRNISAVTNTLLECTTLCWDKPECKGAEFNHDKILPCIMWLNQGSFQYKGSSDGADKHFAMRDKTCESEWASSIQGAPCCDIWEN